MHIVDFPPAGRCLKLSVGAAEALVTLDVGPRILFFGPRGGENMLKVYPDGGSLGQFGMKHYGGHRLWYGPEDRERTYQPDNEPVTQSEKDGWAWFASAPDKFGIQKQIGVQLDEAAGALNLNHVVTNHSSRVQTLFPWALTVMAPGGACHFPFPPFRPHTEDLLPASQVVLWSYTNMNDPRWSWGPRIGTLKQTLADTPQKIGMLVRQGYAAYENFGQLFLKRFACDERVEYPDFGCNFETFSNAEMLEVESLGPTVELKPGGSTALRETWYLIQSVRLPENREALAAELDAIARDRPFR